ncbi:MAG: lasso RiPP family leader peptide-containing protein [Longimicrobiaceae bacterium]
MYQKPRVERFGTFRELTQAGGANEPGDGVHPFHRS